MHRNELRAKAELAFEFWQSVEQTPADHIKSFRLGSQVLKAVDAHYQLCVVTAHWGHYGDTWGLRNLQWSIDKFDNNFDCISLSAEFFCPLSTFEIAVDMPYTPNDDCRKKLMTTARKKALSYLGWNADIYMGVWDDERYYTEEKAKAVAKEGVIAAAEVAVASAKTRAELIGISTHARKLSTSDLISQDQLEVILKMVDDKIVTLPPDDEIATDYQRGEGTCETECESVDKTSETDRPIDDEGVVTEEANAEKLVGTESARRKKKAAPRKKAARKKKVARKAVAGGSETDGTARSGDDIAERGPETDERCGKSVDPGIETDVADDIAEAIYVTENEVVPKETVNDRVNADAPHPEQESSGPEESGREDGKGTLADLPWGGIFEG